MIWMKKNLKTWWKYFDFGIDLYLICYMLYDIIKRREIALKTLLRRKRK